MKTTILILALTLTSFASAKPKTMVAEIYKRNGVWIALDTQDDFRQYRLASFPRAYQGRTLKNKFYFASITGEETTCGKSRCLKVTSFRPERYDPLRNVRSLAQIRMAVKDRPVRPRTPLLPSMGR